MVFDRDEDSKPVKHFLTQAKLTLLANLKHMQQEILHIHENHIKLAGSQDGTNELDEQKKKRKKNLLYEVFFFFLFIFPDKLLYEVIFVILLY